MKFSYPNIFESYSRKKKERQEKYKQLLRERHEREKQWHVAFAWFPTRLEDDRLTVVWLEKYYRKRIQTARTGSSAYDKLFERAPQMWLSEVRSIWPYRKISFEKAVAEKLSK